MRAPVLFSNWLKWTLWSRTAANAFTGTLTSPKLMDPLQIARAMTQLYPAPTPCQLVTVLVALATTSVTGSGSLGLSCVDGGGQLLLAHGRAAGDLLLLGQ